MNLASIDFKKERIREFDIARAFAIIVMVAVHTEVAVYSYRTPWFATLFDYLGSPFAAPTFTFILGANIYLSSHNSPKQLFTRGISLFGLSFIFNVICHALPFFILDYVNKQTVYAEDALHWVFAADILTFAGLAFMFFAAVKKLRLKNRALAAIGIAASVLNTVLTQHGAVDFGARPLSAALTGLFYNSSVTGYFSFLGWIIFPIAGYIFVQVLVKIKNKNRFYLIASGTSLLIYLACIWISYKRFPELPFIEYTEEYSYYRMHPFNAFGNVAFCVAWMGILYFAAKMLPKCLDRPIARLNRNLTHIYLIQWFLINYCFVLPFNNTFFVNEWQFILCFVAVLIAADRIAWLYEKYKAWRVRP